MKEDHEYARRVLLLAAGLSPQVVTETLYYLCIKRQPAFIPTELYVITTLEGAELAKSCLLDEKNGKFIKFCNDYQLKDIQFSESNVLVVSGKRGQLLSDIRSTADNEAVADFIAEKLRIFTNDENSAIHVSIAGGRKTMGYYLGYALSIFGRKQDKLSHVLVEEKFESNREFYFPAPHTQKITGDHGKTLDTKQAHVELAEIPYLRVREDMPQDVLQHNLGFNQTIELAQRIKWDTVIDFDLAKKTLKVSGYHVPLPSSQYVFYVWFCLQTVLRDGSLVKPIEVEPNIEHAKNFWGLHKRIYPGKKMADEYSELIQAGMSKGYFEERCSRVNKQLKKVLGSKLGGEVSIKATGKRGSGAYKLLVVPSSVLGLDVLSLR